MLEVKPLDKITVKDIRPPAASTAIPFTTITRIFMPLLEDCFRSETRADIE